ncbi:unnamed protein product, partial [marine sediment metagenome]
MSIENCTDQVKWEWLIENPDKYEVLVLDNDDIFIVMKDDSTIHFDEYISG